MKNVNYDSYINNFNHEYCNSFVKVSSIVRIAPSASVVHQFLVFLLQLKEAFRFIIISPRRVSSCPLACPWWRWQGGDHQSRKVLLQHPESKPTLEVI